eukprot:s1667_g2.t1
MCPCLTNPASKSGAWVFHFGSKYAMSLAKLSNGNEVSRIPVGFYMGAQKKGMKLAMDRRKDCAAATGCCEREEPPVPADGGTESDSSEETDSREKFAGC